MGKSKHKPKSKSRNRRSGGSYKTGGSGPGDGNWHSVSLRTCDGLGLAAFSIHDGQDAIDLAEFHGIKRLRRLSPDRSNHILGWDHYADPIPVIVDGVDSMIQSWFFADRRDRDEFLEGLQSGLAKHGRVMVDLREPDEGPTVH